MDNKLKLKVVRTLTVPSSVQKTLMNLYDLVECEWGVADSWDKFFEVSQTIIRQEASNDYLDMVVRYVDDKNEGE